MTPRGNAALRQLALTVIDHEAGSHPDAAAIATAASRAYAELAQVSVPLIGADGVHALTDRAVHLARREHPWITDTKERVPTETAFLAVVASVRERDAASAAEGAAAVLGTFAGLLVSLIGEGLTLRLLREAWRSGFEREADTP